jgi:hypothetical protein
MLQALPAVDPKTAAAQNESEGEKDVMFGFKRNLVQIIANASFRCRAVQDQVRTAGAIPAILGCAWVDHSNPCMRVDVRFH